MLKKVFLAAALTLGVVGMSVTTAPTQAYACKSGCFKKAKAMFGHHHWKQRHAYRKACHKAWRKHHKHHWFRH
jgi:uncharacterized membrane protein YbaN (DUF454 family)